jgi:glycerophosphoryl diester phosphodiesterase
VTPPRPEPDTGRLPTRRHWRRGFVGHRGLQAAAPENTLKAITDAGRHGMVMCEVDPGISSDGVWFLMHDASVDRTTGGTGDLGGLPAALIDALTIRGPAGTTSPDEVLHPPRLVSAVREAAYWGMGLNVDGGKFRWNEELALTLWDVLLNGGIAHLSAISLPFAADRATFAQYVPDLPVIWASSVSTVDQDLRTARENHRYPIMAYESSLLHDAAIAQCNAAGVPVYVWAADSFRDANRWLRAGVTFVETDFELPGGEW